MRLPPIYGLKVSMVGSTLDQDPQFDTAAHGGRA